MGTRSCQTWTDLKAEDSSSDEDESPAMDAMLGGLQLGINTIRTHTRTTVGKCDTASKKDMISRIEDSTLTLIRGEKMFLETARIVAGIVDDISSDTEDDEEGDGVVFKPNANHNWDKLMPKLPGPSELLSTREKMAHMLDDRMHDYEVSLTKLSLEAHPKYVALQKQITLGEEDFARVRDAAMTPCHGGTDGETHGIHCPHEDNTEYGEESPDGDEDSILPSKDPISKKYIMNPVRNKHCNHVFEESSIMDFIEKNPESRCPMFRCLNTKPVEVTDLVTSFSLTCRIRNKNTS